MKKDFSPSAAPPTGTKATYGRQFSLIAGLRKTPEKCG
jgi:hypothetical protein